MGEQFFRAYVEQGSTAGEPGTPIRFVAATEGIKRDGLDLRMSGVRLDNYRRNPIVTWAHDIFGNRLPIGKGEAFTDADRLMVDIRFDGEDEFARQVEGKYRRGFLNAVSVNWLSLRMEGREITEWELLEIAAVPVPGDPEALMKRWMLGEGRDLTPAPLLEGEGQDLEDGERAWEAAAIGMMRLMHPAAGTLSEKERRAQYNRLAAQYRRLGRVAPEFLKGEELDGLGLEELRGLFLEDEPELIPGWFSEERAGAVLNARNKADLQEATRLISGVLERATPMEEEDSPQRSQSSQREEVNQRHSGTQSTRQSGNEEEGDLARTLEQVLSLFPKT